MTTIDLRYLVLIAPDSSTTELLEEIDQSMADASDDPSAGPLLQVAAIRECRMTGGTLVTVVGSSSDESVEEAALEDAVGAMEGALQTEGLALSVVRVYDSRTHDENARVARRLFEVESALREALTTLLLVLLADSDHENLLGPSRVKPLGDVPNGTELKKRFENDLWYLSFSEYKSIGGVKLPTNVNDLLKVIQANEDFDSLRDSLSAEMPFAPPGPEFIANLRAPLESLEKARNAIAHNRALSSKVRQNFEQSVPILEGAIAEFHQRVAVLLAQSSFDGQVEPAGDPEARTAM